MKNNLVKRTSTKEVDGKKIRFVNYFLVFENGVELPVVPKYYTTKSTKKEDIEKLTNVNIRNSAKFDSLADVDEVK